MASLGRGVLCALIMLAAPALQVHKARAADTSGNLSATGETQSARTIVRLTQAKLKPLRDSETNLLAPDQGGQALKVPNDGWLKPISGKEGDWTYVSPGQEAVYAFKDEKPATFWKFSVLITAEDNGNLKQIEVLAGNDSPIGTFQSVGKLDIVNAKMIKFPYQEVSFAETTARYVKIKILAGYGGSHFLRQIRLLGSPVE